MFRIIAILLVLTSVSAHGQDQKKRIMLYSSSEKFLIPLVESSLSELKTNENILFTDITNLNEVSASITSEKYLREAISFFSNKNSILSDSVKRIQEKVFNLLTNYDYFLSININKIESTLEYQFYLYDVSSLINTSLDSSFTMPIKNIIRPKYRTSFLIDIHELSYPRKIKTEILKMFPECNNRPTAVVSEGLKEGKVFFIGIGDTLLLNGNFSSDYETSFSDLVFIWKNRTEDSLQQMHGILMRSSNQSCTIIAAAEGIFKIGLQVFDGISYSIEDTILINVSRRPQAVIFNPQLYNFYQMSIFEKIQKERIPIYVFCSNYETVDSSKVIIYALEEKKDTLSLITAHFKKENIPFVTTYSYPMPSLNKYLLTPQGVTGFSISKIEEGVRLNMEFLPQINFKGKYSIRILEDNLESKPMPVSFRNDVYSPLSVILSYQYLRLGIFDRQPGDSGAFFSPQTINIGYSGRLLNFNGNGLALEVFSSMGVFLDRKIKISDKTYDLDGNFRFGLNINMSYPGYFNMGFSFTNTFWPVSGFKNGSYQLVSTAYLFSGGVFIEKRIVTNFPFAIGCEFNMSSNATLLGSTFRPLSNIEFYLRKFTRPLFKSKKR